MNIIEAIKAVKEGKKVRRKEWTIYYKVSKTGHLIDLYNCCDNSLIDVYELDDPSDVIELYTTFINIDHVLAEDWEVVE